ncbi:hypothetical protein H4R20_007247, partial [Coemansia guatemalensis]
FFSADCSPDAVRHCDEDHFSAQQRVPELTSNSSINSSEAAGQSRSSLAQWSLQSPRRPARILSTSASGSVAAERQNDSHESLDMHDPVAVVPACSPRRLGP